MGKSKPLSAAEMLVVTYTKQLLQKVLEDKSLPNPKSIPLGALANTLKTAHPSGEYVKTYDFLKGRGRVGIEEMGFMIVKEGAVKVKQTCLAEIQNTYDVCVRCKIRILCLEKNLKPQLVE